VHICYVCPEYPPAPHGGIGSFTQTLAREFVNRGHRVTVVGAYAEIDAPEDDDQGVRVLRFRFGSIAPLRFLTNRTTIHSAITRVHARLPIDILEGGELDLGLSLRALPGLKVLRMHGGPTVFSPGARPRLAATLAERWSFHAADHLIAVSRFVADATRRLLKLGDRTITVIPNPVDADLFRPSADILEEPGLIVFTGTITERKGICELLAAMPRILKEVPSARLAVYGGDAIGGAGKPLMNVLANSLPAEIANRIEWKGRVPRASLPSALHRASVCIYPSHVEAMPIAWLEAMACGKAVVASSTGPGPELIDDGVTGLLCDPRDPDSIAEKVIQVLRDADLRGRLGAAARRVAEQRFSLPALVERNLEYYSQILRVRAGSVPI
jgi:glycosyltransferase involved in cell wall biosynthesis